MIVLILAVATSGGGNKDKNPQKVGETATATTGNKTAEAQTADSETEEETEAVNNVFSVGDIVETQNMKITYVSSGEYQSDDDFMQPKDGYVYWEFEFKFENISDSDQTVSSMMDWECYADNSKVDQAWIGSDNGLDATLSSGRETQGTIYFEVPEDAQNIELEYDINFWQSDKIVFVGK